jgi:hypothetical protein
MAFAVQDQCYFSVLRFNADVSRLNTPGDYASLNSYQPRTRIDQLGSEKMRDRSRHGALETMTYANKVR